MFNIIEGCGAASQREFARFLDTSIKSAFELEGQLELAKDYGVVSEDSWNSLSARTVGVRRMLFGLRTKVLLSIKTEESRGKVGKGQRNALVNCDLQAEQVDLKESQDALTRKHFTQTGERMTQ